MPKMKRGGQTSKKGGSVIDSAVNDPAPKNKSKNKNQKGKKQSRGK